MSMMHKTGCVAAVLLAGFFLTGCGKEEPTEPPKQGNPFASLPFVLVPGPNGNLEPRAADGRPIPPSQTPPAEQIKAISNLSQVAVLKIEGSCYYLVYVGGRWYQMPC